jgi:hypothetical protein
MVFANGVVDKELFFEYKVTSSNLSESLILLFDTILYTHTIFYRIPVRYNSRRHACMYLFNLFIFLKGDHAKP